MSKKLLTLLDMPADVAERPSPLRPFREFWLKGELLPQGCFGWYDMVSRVLRLTRRQARVGPRSLVQVHEGASEIVMVSLGCFGVVASRDGGLIGRAISLELVVWS